MLNKLIEMDRDLKEFICEKIFKDRVAVKTEIIFDGEDNGYSEQTILNALDIFMYNGLIEQPLGLLPMNKEFLISDSKFNELKAQGYL